MFAKHTGNEMTIKYTFDPDKDQEFWLRCCILFIEYNEVTNVKLVLSRLSMFPSFSLGSSSLVLPMHSINFNPMDINQVNFVTIGPSR